MRFSFIIQLFFIVVLIFSFASCISHTRTLDIEEGHCFPMYRFLIPDGYVGWIRIDFNIKDAPALPTEGDYLVFTIPPSGYLKAPVKYSCGYPSDYYYYSGKSRKQLDTKKMIRWNGFPSGYEPDPNIDKEITDYIFIGTEQEFEKLRHSTYDTKGLPRYGNLNNSFKPQY